MLFLCKATKKPLQKNLKKLKISGFTIIKNAIDNDFPVVEAIKSILPLVDEMVVLIGDSEDDTEGLIRSIGSPKIKIHHSVWDPALRKGGKVLAVETNKAFNLIDPESTWAFYIQADEVVHEKYHAAILTACRQHQNDPNVQGLLFDYEHFYGTYQYVGDSRRWYNKEVRIIKNDKKISAYRDAQGFRVGNIKLKVKLANATVYHYGWVKSPKQMHKKHKNSSKFWNTDEELSQRVEVADVFNFDDFDSLVKFTGTHPQVMQQRVNEQNWNLNIDISTKRFSMKDRLLYAFEKLTGIRPFDFKNYRII